MSATAWNWADYARCARAEATKASRRSREAPLASEVRDGMLVISVGIETLARMFERRAGQDTAPVAAPPPLPRTVFGDAPAPAAAIAIPPERARELPAAPDGPAAEPPRKCGDSLLAPAGDAAKPAGLPESAQLGRARDLLAMGLHLNDVLQAVALTNAERKTLKREIAR
jgi:hypothetical protein